MARISKRQSNFPQLGSEGESYQMTDKSGAPKLTQAGNPAMAMRFGAVDFTDQSTRAAAMGNLIHSISTAPQEALQTGPQWYPKVNQAVHKGITGRGSRGFLSGQSDKVLAGAGLVAAVSPNMDWDTANIHAFSEMKGLKAHHWDAIAHGTDQQARDAVAGLSIGRSGRPNLQKAGRIIAGEHPDEVLSLRTAPKTHNFMHNIADPSDPNYATIDGRAFDTLTNRMRPWETGRGISSAGVKGGAQTTRYEHARNIVQHVAGQFGMTPSEAQATSWEHVKYGIEQAGGTRKQGPARVGQPYFHPETGEPAAHMGLQFGR